MNLKSFKEMPEEEFWEELNKIFTMPSDPKKKALVEKLKSYGIDKIDALIITHSDYDHMSTAKDIIAQFDTNILVSSFL